MALVAFMIGAFACGGAPAVVDPPVIDAGPMLDGSCATLTEADAVSYDCERFVAVDAVAARATSAEVERALDEFADHFGGNGSERLVTNHVQGAVEEWAIRVARSGDAGGMLEARMVAILEGDSVRMMSCSARKPGVSCATVLNELAAR